MRARKEDDDDAALQAERELLEAMLGDAAEEEAVVDENPSVH
jgi:hypothetical protein